MMDRELAQRRSSLQWHKLLASPQHRAKPSTLLRRAMNNDPCTCVVAAEDHTQERVPLAGVGGIDDQGNEAGNASALPRRERNHAPSAQLAGFAVTNHGRRPGSGCVSSGAPPLRPTCGGGGGQRAQQHWAQGKSVGEVNLEAVEGRACDALGSATIARYRSPWPMPLVL